MSIQSIAHNVVTLLTLLSPAPVAPHFAYGQEVTFRAVYRDYKGFVLGINETTERAHLLIYDDILDGGCFRELSVDLDRVQS